MPAPGSQYDRFEVEEVLGQGGMATVYRVRHTTLGSLHALKVLDLPFPSIRARLVQEGRVQARLRHPHIVAVTDLIDVDGSPGLIMEYIHGPTLQTWLHGNRADPATATRLMAGILDATAFAHREGLIHRDLKPGNVLLQDVDGRLFPKVTDFGLAKLLGGSAAEHRTRTGFAMGTPGYMAPEQVRSAKDVDARADIYALGCILYELWCGARAFPGDDVFATLELMERAQYADPRALTPGIPEAVVAAIHAALVPDRERRAPSCDALRTLLEGPRTPVSASTQAMWAGGEGVATAVSAQVPYLPPPPPPHHDAAAPTSARTYSAPTLDVFADPPPRSSAGLAVGALVGGAALLLGAGVLLCGGGWWWIARSTPTEPPIVEDLPIPEVPAMASREPTPAPEPPPVTTVVAPTPSVVKPTPSSTVAASPATAPPDTPTATESVAPTGADTPRARPPAASTPTSAPTPASPGRFAVSGAVDRVWLERDGRRFGPGPVDPGDYVLHAAWGSDVIERRATVVSGQTLNVTCDRAFVNCTVQ